MRTISFRNGPSPAHLTWRIASAASTPRYCDPGVCRKPCGADCGAAPESFAGGGQRLASLQDSPLLRNFYCWRGASGARYVCSVFQSAEDAAVAGFDGAAIIGVASRAGTPLPFCVLDSASFRSLEGVELRARMRDRPDCEWHVRFEADAETLCDLLSALRQ